MLDACRLVCGPSLLVCFPFPPFCAHLFRRRSAVEGRGVSSRRLAFVWTETVRVTLGQPHFPPGKTVLYVDPPSVRAYSKARAASCASTGSCSSHALRCEVAHDSSVEQWCLLLREKKGGRKRGKGSLFNSIGHRLACSNPFYTFFPLPPFPLRTRRPFSFVLRVLVPPHPRPTALGYCPCPRSCLSADARPHPYKLHVRSAQLIGSCI